jgi:hypothetical protein
LNLLAHTAAGVLHPIYADARRRSVQNPAGLKDTVGNVRRTAMFTGVEWQLMMAKMSLEAKHCYKKLFIEFSMDKH